MKRYLFLASTYFGLVILANWLASRYVVSVGFGRVAPAGVFAWHMLTRGEDYAFVRPSLVREKIRRLELMVGAERRQGRRNPVRVFATSEQHRLEKELAAQAELAYRRLMVDWTAQRRKGTGAAPGRASSAARQGTAPHPAL